MSIAITSLPLATTITGSELVPVVQGGVTKAAQASFFVTGYLTDFGNINVLTINGAAIDNAGVIFANGGSIYASPSSPVTFGGEFATVGTSITLVAPSVTAVTLPPGGTLATLDGVETLTNKTIVDPIITGGTIDGATIGGITPAPMTVTTLMQSNRIDENWTIPNGVNALTIGPFEVGPDVTITGLGNSTWRGL